MLSLDPNTLVNSLVQIYLKISPRKTPKPLRWVIVGEANNVKIRREKKQGGVVFPAGAHGPLASARLLRTDAPASSGAVSTEERAK